MEESCDAAPPDMCSVEWRRVREFVRDHACSLPKIEVTQEDPLGLGVGFAPTARHVIVLRPSAIGNSVKVFCDCGTEKDVSHWEHL